MWDASWCGLWGNSDSAVVAVHIYIYMSVYKYGLSPYIIRVHIYCYSVLCYYCSYLILNVIYIGLGFICNKTMCKQLLFMDYIKI